MPTVEQLEEIRARFEASRSFEDDEDWISTNTHKTSGRSTITTAKKSSVDINPALKKWAVQAAMPQSTSRMKFEPSTFWEPSEKTQGNAAGEISGYATKERGGEERGINEYGRTAKAYEPDDKEVRMGSEEWLTRLVARNEMMKRERLLRNARGH